MSTAMDKALIRSRAVISHAHEAALIMKKAGTLSDIFDIGPSAGIAQISAFQDQGANRRRYALFRGWVHAAVNALAVEASGQEPHVGRMTGGKNNGKPKQQKNSRLVKDYDIRKMPKFAATKAAKEQIEVFQDHPLLDSLNKPNPIQYGWQFVYSFVANLCLTGWGYIVGGTNDEGEIEFYSIPTTWVHPDHSEGAFSKFRIINPSNPTTNAEPLTREQVAFAYLPNPADPLAALAPAQAQNEAVKIDERIQTSQVLFFENALFPSAIVTIGKNPHPDVPGGMRPRLSAAQRRQVYGAIRKVSAGVANYGNPAIIDGMIESIERLSATQNEIGWEKSEKSVRTRILSAFGVHPFILGEEMAGSYAQAYVVQDRFCRRVNVFLSLLGTIMTDFAPPLLGKNNDDKMLVWWEEAKATDPSMEKSLWEGARGRDDITQNEFRAFMNLPPDEDDNEAHIDKTSVQAISGLAAQVKAGGIAPEQAVAILTALGLPEDIAEGIAGEGPDESDMASQQQGGFGGQQGGFGGDQGGNGEQGGGFGDATSQLDEALKAMGSAEQLLNKSAALSGG